MILSILIPVYNYNCVALVKALQQQAENCNIDYEILVADDGSDNAAIVCQNREINAIPHSHYHEMGKNHGRSWIRNWLVGQSQGEFLLFIDSDAEVCNAHFIGNYLRHVEKGAIICGGIYIPRKILLPRDACDIAMKKQWNLASPHNEETCIPTPTCAPSIS